MNYEQWEKCIPCGRKEGSVIANPYRKVYKIMKQEGLDVDYKTFSNILRTVADKVWKKLYAGHIVAIPYLFNMEVVRNHTLHTKAVNWKRTRKLWSEDEDAFNERLLVRHIPTRHIVKIKHSTLPRERSRWFWPLMMEIRLNVGMLRELESRYELR